jgi:Leucine-rich repeat (LRR) protein
MVNLVIRAAGLHLLLCGARRWVPTSHMAGHPRSGRVCEGKTRLGSVGVWIRQKIKLTLGANNFSGKIPPAIGTLCPAILTLDANQIEASRTEGWEFITHLTNCTRLRVLSFQYNKFTGELPGSVANLSTHLQVLYTGFNQIRGRIPPDIGKLVGLQKLQLSQNHFIGDLPRTIGLLKMLRALGVDGNMLSGTIPTSVGNLTQLQMIMFDDNNFQGSLPVSIRNLQQLNSANLSHNAFTGPFPKEIFNLSSLSSYLDLSGNLFVGPLPPQVASLTKLAYLGISQNNLSGSLPDTLSNCQSLVEFHLDSNSFSGSLPATISEMRGLVALNLTKNTLSGDIPQELGRMKGLQELYLAHNSLSGQIPATIQNMTSLYRLDVSFNHLSGQVPLRGVFSNSTGFLFVGNDGLCGGMRELHLLPCPVQSWKHKETKHRVIIIIVVISTGILLCLVLAILFYLRRRRAAHSTTIPTAALSLFDDKYPKVSYTELVQGTDGFAATNLIGRGRYGSVYKGRLSLKNAETVVAVKVFDLEQSGSSKSFVVECEALGKIRHRNLISVITCCSSYDSRQNDFKALVFEFMPNQSLDKWLHDPKEGSDVSRPIPGLTLMQRLNIALDVANGLNYLHNNCEPPIIHCDLKPSNILLNEDFVACIGDFGLAKFLSDSEGEQAINSKSTSAVRGTIGYVAPGNSTYHHNSILLYFSGAYSHSFYMHAP